MEKKFIYLDYHSTTPMDERVFEAMKPYFLNQFGNPGSYHTLGWQAQSAVDEARINVAKAINAHPTEIIFTSGATESTNMALKGLLQGTKCQVITSSIEHKATLSTLSSLDSSLVKHTLIKPTCEGFVNEQDILKAMNNDTRLVSLFMVHNEVGSINNISAIAKAVKARGALFHCDAAQALGRVAIDCQKMDIDLMSLSGHKVYGPKGVGCLYIRRSLMDKLLPLIHGGCQEGCKRSGTLNVPGIVGMGEAFKLAVSDMDAENARIRGLRDLLWQNLSALDGIFLNGSFKNRVSGNLNVSVGGIDGEELVLSVCERIALSTGSACNSYNHGKNHVLEELSVPKELCQSSLRFGLGRFTTKEDIDDASELLVEKIKELRKKSSPKKLVGLKSGIAKN